jgi:hypothetical protein
MVKNNYPSTTTNHVSLSRLDKKEYGLFILSFNKNIDLFGYTFRDELQKIFPKNKAKQYLMLKVQLYVVYKLLNHVVQLHFYKPVKQCIVLQKIWIFIVTEYH